MTNITKLYEVSGVEAHETPSREYDADGEICSYYVEYPPFTAEKQLELIKWVALHNEDCRVCYDKEFKWCCQTYAEGSYYYKDFPQALAGLILQLWDKLTDTQKEEIKEILG